MTGGKVLPAIQVDLIGRNLQNNNIQMPYVSMQNHPRHFLFNNNRANSASSARKCLFGPSDPLETQKLYAQCVENGRQRIINNYDFDIFTEKFCGGKKSANIEGNNGSGSDTCGNNENENKINVVQLVNDNIGKQQNLETSDSIVNVQQNNDDVDMMCLRNNQHNAMETSTDADKWCNVNNIDEKSMVASKSKRNLKRTHPYGKITGMKNIYRLF